MAGRPPTRDLTPMNHVKLCLLLCVGVATGLGVPKAASAQAGTAAAPQLTDAQRAEADRAIGHIKSPWCPGLMLEVCPSPQAEEFRQEIEAAAADGVVSDSIVDLMLAQIGEEWRAYPKATGQGLLAWLVPPVMLLLGLLAVAGVLRRMREKNPESLPDLTEEQERQVEDVLHRLEQAEREAAEVN